MEMKQSLRCLWLALLLWSGVAVAAEFRVSDIRLQGLQRVSAGTVFNLLPIQVGDTLDEMGVRRLIRLLFNSGYFSDVRMARDSDVLVITLVERPAIESIELDGNKAIKSDALLDGLSQQGLKEGEIFKQATLERVGVELERQYVAQGRYGATIDTDVEELPRNRVAIKINIVEGKNSGIRQINLVGATSYPQEEILETFELKHPSLFSFFRNDDKYAREKLSGDLEKLEAFYKDRGHVQFAVDSTQVSIAPDRRQVYISINLTEGDIYTIREVNLLGDLNDVRAEDLQRLITVQPGETFSQARVTATEELLTQSLGNSGYTFATATGVPKINDDGTVDLQFMVDAGKRAYVHRITFSGNAVTQDQVMRREMRQMEGGWASTALIELSKVRLERLGYFKGVNVETPEVAGTDDQVDVNFSLEEQPSGSVSATLGYSQGYGLILGGNYQENNVFGTGNSMGLGLSWSEFQRAATFNFFNPYFTQDGISRGFNVFYRESDYEEANIARYTTDAYGVGLNFGFPIGETQRITFGGMAEYTSITEGVFPVREVEEFLNENGDESLNYKMNLSWTSSTLNRGIFPTRGRQQTIGLEVAVPASDLYFFKLQYDGQMYFPLTQRLSGKLRAQIGYGDGYGDTESLPFYEHFYAGGFGSVRGFEQNTLGPRSTEPMIDPDGAGPLPPQPVYGGDPEPFGGNLLVEAGAEIIFPLPFLKDDRAFRSVLFFDAGQVFNTECPQVSEICEDFDPDLIVYSTGISVTWLAGMGPMTFGISFPVNGAQYEDEERFQFELGRTF
jgi:outer membrane protein insertion porin family